jgi:hypothetical protein
LCRGSRLGAGYCIEPNGWTSGPDTSADDDLRRARFIIAGLAGEAICGLDKPGSSLDELALSQSVGLNAAAKLADPHLSEEAYSAWAQQLWHERVWGVALAILRANQEPFQQLVQLLHRKGKAQGSGLRKVMAQVQRIAP